MYICISSNGKYLYTVNEIKRKPDCVNTDGSIWAFKIQDDGTLSELNHISSCGVFPNYVAVSSDGKALFAVNYGSEDMVVRSCRGKDGSFFLKNIYEESSMISISLCNDGSLGEIKDIKIFDGEPSGFYPWFQSSPHPHCIGMDPSNQMLLVADRGCDEIITCNCDTSDGKLSNFHTYKTNVGFGPRNCIFHPTQPYVYVVGEIQPLIDCYYYDASLATLEKVGQYLCAPENLIYQQGKDFYSCAHPSDIKIHPNGSYLYVANRGPNTISCFCISKDKGTLKFLCNVSSGGDMPWSMAFDKDGMKLYVGNRDSGDITLFSLDNIGYPKQTFWKIKQARTVALRSHTIE